MLRYLFTVIMATTSISIVLTENAATREAAYFKSKSDAARLLEKSLRYASVNEPKLSSHISEVPTKPGFDISSRFLIKTSDGPNYIDVYENGDIDVTHSDGTKVQYRSIEDLRMLYQYFQKTVNDGLHAPSVKFDTDDVGKALKDLTKIVGSFKNFVPK